MSLHPFTAATYETENVKHLSSWQERAATKTVCRCSGACCFTTTVLKLGLHIEKTCHDASTLSFHEICISFNLRWNTFQNVRLFTNSSIVVISRTIADHKLIDVSIIKEYKIKDSPREEIYFLRNRFLRDSFDTNPPIPIYVHCNVSDESCLPMHGNMFRRVKFQFTVGINALIRVYEATLRG